MRAATARSEIARKLVHVRQVLLHAHAHETGTSKGREHSDRGG